MGLRGKTRDAGESNEWRKDHSDNCGEEIKMRGLDLFLNATRTTDDYEVSASPCEVGGPVPLAAVGVAHEIILFFTF